MVTTLKNKIFLPSDPFMSALRGLLQRDLPAAIAFRLECMFSDLEKKFEIFDEKRIELVDKHRGEKKKDAKEDTRPEMDEDHKNWEKFIKELNELSDVLQKYTFDKVVIPVGKWEREGRDYVIPGEYFRILKDVLDVRL